jgi:hypothetical protein
VASGAIDWLTAVLESVFAVAVERLTRLVPAQREAFQIIPPERLTAITSFQANPCCLSLALGQS